MWIIYCGKLFGVFAYLHSGNLVFARSGVAQGEAESIKFIV